MDATMGMYSTEEIQDADIVVDAKAVNVGVPDEQDLPGSLEKLSPEVDELADMAVSAEDDAAEKGDDPKMEETIEKIKFKVVEGGCDLKQFKEWHSNRLLGINSRIEAT